MEEYVELTKVIIEDEMSEEIFIGKFEDIDHVSVLVDYIKKEGLSTGNEDIKEEIEFVENGLVRFKVSDDIYIYSGLV